MGELKLEPPLSEMVAKICLAGSPKEIVLFGSRARGDARLDSDIDLLVVESSNLPRYKRAARYRKAVAGLFIAKDMRKGYQVLSVELACHQNIQIRNRSF